MHCGILESVRGNPAARSGDSAAIIDETVAATRHIVSTTLTTVAGFMPLLLLTGGDFWPPLAIVIAGGVGLSGLLSLVFTPVAYRLLSRALRTAPPLPDPPLSALPAATRTQGTG